ncbi:UNVERIFIED_CONTAM: carbohydrate-binding protein, partial [Prevotella sp. 15_C9]
GCDDNLETFEIGGSTAAPTAIATSAVNSDPLPGQIKLTWNTPSEGAFEYLQIKYHDPLTEQVVCKIASIGTTEMLIEDTRARFGDYSFFFQTFNAAHQGSEVTEIKAKSGAAPSTTTEKSRTEMKIEADQLSTNAQEPS